MSRRVEPLADQHTAAALAAFLAWPAPHVEAPDARPGRSRPPRRSVLASALLCWSTCVVLGAVSFAAPLIASGGHTWALGPRLLLFCHLG